MRIEAIRFVILVPALWGCNGQGCGDGTGGRARGSLDDERTDVPPDGVPGGGDSFREEWFVREREKLVDDLASPLHEIPISDARVLEALRKVPRHEFVPLVYRDQSYENAPLPIGGGQTISQPYIVGLMTQLLELEGGEKVLEIGTGSGYQAAILGELAAEVYTVEIRADLLESARKKLEELAAKGTLRQGKIVCIVGDGWKGYEPAAPYDAIIVTAAPDHVPAPLIEQLKPGGRLVIPVGDFFQELQLIRKAEDGTIAEKSIVAVRFVPLVGGDE